MVRIIPINYMKTVSIIIPVYNGEKYIKAAIDSALRQTVKCPVIVCSDGSTDNTNRICMNYGYKIQFMSNPVNMGVGYTLNRLIERANTDYISWLSADDTYDPNKIELSLKHVNGNNVVYGNYSLMNGEGKVYKQNIPVNKDGVNAFIKNEISGCTLMFPKKLWEECGRFNPELKTTQDYDLWFKMLLKAKFTHIDASLINSRIHAEQGTRTISTVKQDIHELWEHVANNWPNTWYDNLDIAIKHYEERGYKSVNTLKSVKESNTAKVSVIIPTWNREKVVVNAINSVKNSRYGNVEVVVVDDGSTDGTRDKLTHTPGIKYIYQDHNSAGHARNTGISNATGSILVFLDSDDTLYPETLKLAVNSSCAGKVIHYSYTRNMDKVIHSGNYNLHNDPEFSRCVICQSGLTITKGFESRYPETSLGEDHEFYRRLLTEGYRFTGIDVVGCDIHVDEDTIKRRKGE